MDVHDLPGKRTEADDVYMRRKTNVLRLSSAKAATTPAVAAAVPPMMPQGKNTKLSKATAEVPMPPVHSRAVRSRRRIKCQESRTSISPAPGATWAISPESGEAYSRDQAEAAVKEFQPWNDVIADFHDHLGRNELDAGKLDIKLGAMLELDVANESFTGATATPEALALLTREYRAGFEVPKEV